MPIATLTSRGVMALHGPDARSLLQGVITNNMQHLTKDQMVFAALLTPQGKMLYDMLLAEVDGRILMEVERVRLPDLIQKLTMYKLRADVTIEDASDEFAVQAGWDEQMTGLGDPRYARMGARHYGASLSATAQEADYHAHRLNLGVPEGATDLVPEQSLVLENRLDVLNGVDFTKGCYVGQEVTARSKHRGNVRKQLFIVRGNKLPEPGEAILADDKTVGTMRSSQGGAGLAMLKLDAVDKTLATEEGEGLQVALPPYVQ